MLKYLMCLLGFALTVCSLSNNPVINSSNLRKTFESVKPYSDLSNAFYSIKSLDLLGDKALDAQSAKEVCEFAKAKVDKNSLESIYYATSLASLIPNCVLDSASFQATLSKGDSATSVPELYYYVMTAEILKSKLDSKKLAASLTNALKTDSSILNQGFSLHIASKLAENNKPFYESIEDILDQADEVDGVLLQYEGGVGTTSIVLEGIFDMAEKFNKFPAKLSNERLAKFINYLVSKRFPGNIKSAYYLLRTATKLSNNKFAIPLFLNRLSSVSVSPSASNLLVSLTNILGGAVNDPKVNLDALSAISSNSKTTLFTGKKSFTAKSSDRTSFDVKLVDSQQLTPGFYAVTVGLNADKKFFLTKKSVEVKVTTKVDLSDVLMSVSDRDTTSPKLEKFTGKQLKFEADQQSKLTLKFGVKDQKKNSLVEAHQAFLKFTEVKTGREIIYLAETGLTKTYTVEIDFGSNAKNFRHQSGKYSVELVVSDSLFENPTVLKLSELSVTFVEESTAGVEKSLLYSKKPEIKHLFRQPEKRPPPALSLLFAALCFVPMCLVLLLWLKIGFNFSKFQFSLSGLVFHLSLAGIFGLFYCYWVQINMFQTVRYLGALGLVALFSGNQLLRSLASKK